MRIYLSILICIVVSLNSFSQGCSIAPDTRTLTQLLYKNDNKLLVFSCKVISSGVLQDGSAYSIAEVKEVYFGKTTLKKVNIITGHFQAPTPPLFLRPQTQKQEIKKDYNMGNEIVDKESFTSSGGSPYWGIKMKVDSFYIIYSNNDTSYNQNYMPFNKQLTQTPAIKNEIETLKSFTNIFSKKKSGHFIFKDYKNKILADGRYKKGKPNGIWKHFNDVGILISLEKYKQNICKIYYLNGNLSTTIITYKDSTVTENYVNNPMLQFSYKSVHIKSDTGYIDIYTTFNKNGRIIDKKSALAVYIKNNGGIEGKGLHGIYQEFYINGQLKLNAQYLLNRRVGCWTWYNENSTFLAEWDYKDGKAPQ